MPRPLFLTGMARGGTNLLARMLIAGGASRIAIHAFQPWFKSLRNAIVRDRAPAEIATRFDPAAPFGDGQFDGLQSAVQKLLHESAIDVPFLPSDWPDLLARLQSRASHDAADLCPRLSSLAGAPDYRAMMDRILALVLEGYEARSGYVGLIDTWIIDFFPALARAYADARFIVVIRDPRAVVASQLKFLDTMPEEVGHILSVIRQWRKYAALGFEFRDNPLLAGRLKFVRYEDQVADPDGFARGLCQFLNLKYHPAMTNLGAYNGEGKRAWSGNSAFEPALRSIDRRATQWWREFLSTDALGAVEYCCGPDMAACGYRPEAKAADRAACEYAARSFLADDDKRASAWRTTADDAAVEFERERSRLRMLEAPVAPDARDVRLAFLSERYFDLLKNGTPLFAVGGMAEA